MMMAVKTSQGSSGAEGTPRESSRMPRAWQLGLGCRCMSAEERGHSRAIGRRHSPRGGKRGREVSCPGTDVT